MFPAHTFDTPGFGAEFKKTVRDHAGAFISMGAFGEVLPRYESYVDLDPDMKDGWGIPVLRFHYQFSDNERKMAEDMVATGREMFEAAGIEVVGAESKILTEGWSIHELGTTAASGGCLARKVPDSSGVRAPESPHRADPPRRRPFTRCARRWSGRLHRRSSRRILGAGLAGAVAVRAPGG